MGRSSYYLARSPPDSDDVHICCGLISGSSPTNKSTRSDSSFNRSRSWIVSNDFQNEQLGSAFVVSGQTSLRKVECGRSGSSERSEERPERTQARSRGRWKIVPVLAQLGLALQSVEKKDARI